MTESGDAINPALVVRRGDLIEVRSGHLHQLTDWLLVHVNTAEVKPEGLKVRGAALNNTTGSHVFNVEWWLAPDDWRFAHTCKLPAKHLEHRTEDYYGGCRVDRAQRMTTQAEINARHHASADDFCTITGCEVCTS